MWGMKLYGGSKLQTLHSCKSWDFATVTSLYLLSICFSATFCHIACVGWTVLIRIFRKTNMGCIFPGPNSQEASEVVNTNAEHSSQLPSASHSHSRSWFQGQCTFPTLHTELLSPGFWPPDGDGHLKLFLGGIERKHSFFSSKAKSSVNSFCVYSSEHPGGMHLECKFHTSCHCSFPVRWVVGNVWIPFSSIGDGLKSFARSSVVSTLQWGGFEQRWFRPKQTLTSEKVWAFPVPRAKLSMQGHLHLTPPLQFPKGRWTVANNSNCYLLMHKLPFKPYFFFTRFTSKATGQLARRSDHRHDSAPCSY